MSKLEEKIVNWDGSNFNELKQIYAEFLLGNPDRFKEVIDLCLLNSNVQIVTTWLVKHHYDQKSVLSDTLTNQLLKVCPLLESWQARLHMLQLIPHLNLSDDSVIIVDDFSRISLRGKNKFVRAWAYESRYKVVTYIPAYKDELQLLCENGMMDSPSVQVRVRAVLKRLEKMK